jgi:hypothetical protein
MVRGGPCQDLVRATADIPMLPVLNTSPVLRTVATAVMPSVLVDLIVYAILRSMPSVLGRTQQSAAGMLSRFFTSLFSNLLTAGAFAFAYQGTWAGMGRPFLFGGAVWVIITAPVLIMSRYSEDSQKRALYVRAFGWLAKIAIISTCSAYFQG